MISARSTLNSINAERRSNAKLKRAYFHNHVRQLNRYKAASECMAEFNKGPIRGFVSGRIVSDLQQMKSLFKTQYSELT